MRVEIRIPEPTVLNPKYQPSCLRCGSEYHSHKRPMENEQKNKEELIAEIQRKVAYLISTDDYTPEEKEAIARRFFQALEAEE